MGLPEQKQQVLHEIYALLTQGRSICAREITEIAAEADVPISLDTAKSSLNKGRLARELDLGLITITYKRTPVAYYSGIPESLIDFSTSKQTIDAALKRPKAKKTA